MWDEQKRFTEEVAKVRSLKGILEQNKRKVYKDCKQIEQVFFISLFYFIG